MEIKRTDLKQLFNDIKPNPEHQKKAPKSGHSTIDTISKAPKSDIYDLDLSVTLSPKVAPKQVATDAGCHQTQSCSTCSGCSQTDSGCYGTQRGC